jgi:hypothetical protein
MKSAVATSACVSFRRYTPASSLVVNPTRTSGFPGTGKLSNNFDSPTGLSFAAQPQVFAKLVRVGF